MIFVNLPVADLAASTRFYQAIGCARNQQFSDEQASSMMWSNTITFQLLTREYFSTFTSKGIPDAHRTCQVLFALSRDTRKEVDDITEIATATGGKADVREIMDLGWLYNRAFADPDGHVFEAVWMDPSAVPSA
jgi:predicted lactoylglutathione lyase